MLLAQLRFVSPVELLFLLFSLTHFVHRLRLDSRYPEARGDGRRDGKVGEADWMAGFQYSRCSLSVGDGPLVNHAVV